MLDGAEGRHGLCAHSLRRRIRREQFRILGLESPQFHHQPVVLGIRDLRIIEGVIATVVSLQQLPQFGGALR